MLNTVHPTNIRFTGYNKMLLYLIVAGPILTQSVICCAPVNKGILD